MTEVDVTKANGILDRYARWWRDEFEVRETSGGVQVVTPMLDRHNDHMSVYIVDAGDGSVVLTDLGQTIGDLRLCGCDVATPSRTSKLGETLRGYGVSSTGDEIYVQTNADDAFKAVNSMMQAMATVDDIFFTTAPSAREYFRDDVGGWLDRNGIRCVPDLKLVGRSGFEEKFDFDIPKTPGVAPERLIKVVSAPSASSVKNVLFGWRDISENRPDSTLYVFMNDPKDGAVDASIINACRAYDARPVPWRGGNVSSETLSELVA